MNTLQENKVKIIPRKNIREGILKFELVMSKIPGVMFGDCFPLKHNFAEGLYVREISVPKGNLIITKIHKLTHPCFILKGDCSILTEEGIKRIKAPYYMITPAGTKRIVYVHDDTIWVTVHATKERDLKKIEEDIIAKNFDEIDGVIDIEAEINNFVTEISPKEESENEKALAQ